MDSFLQFINLDLLNLIFDTLSHDNRFVRETGYYLCASLARYGVCSSDNSDKQMANMLASHLFTGLSDNWSQVRLAASVATRQFFQDFNEEDKVGDHPISVLHTLFYRQLDFHLSLESEAGQLQRNCLVFGQNLRLKAKQPSCL